MKISNTNITSLPRDINPNEIIRKQIQCRYGIKCPYCGEDHHMLDYRYYEHKGILNGGIIEWYGYPDEIDNKRNDRIFLPFFINLITFRFLREKKHHYRINSYTCLTCGLSWETPPYSTDILSYADLKDIVIND